MDEDAPFWSKSEYYNQTTVHPLGLAILLASGLAMQVLPRRWAVIPMLVMACFVAPAQRIVVAGLDFNFIRCMVIFGWARLLMRGEYRGFRWTGLDTAVMVWGIVSTLFYTLQLRQFSAFVYQMGTTYDAVGMYFLFRALVRDWDEITNVITAFVLISVPVLVFFVVERLTRHNMFAVFGGVPEITAIREGRLRCQGAFKHPILAGCFWASLVPMMGALLWQGIGKKFFAVVGAFNAAGIVFLCASSTPVGALGFGGLAWLLFPFRASMRRIRWGLVALLVTLHLSMQNPIWHLLARIDLAGGSTGWHRFKIIDSAVHYWRDWFLVGMPSTAYWGIIDITNEYVLQGLRGGIVTLGAFIATIVLGFSAVGRVIRVEHDNKPRLMMAWGLGVGLFIHLMSFVSVTYFGQIQMLWYLHLAMIGSALTVTQARSEGRARKRRMIVAARRREQAATRKVSPIVSSMELSVSTPEGGQNEG